MQGNALRLLQIYLWLICAFHVVIGVGVNLSRDFIATAAAGYGAEVDLTPQFVTILHPLGAFMFILGVMAAAAAVNPLRYRAVVYGFAVLFLIRAGQRIVFQQDLEQAFHIAPARNWFNMGFFNLLGLSLLGLQRYVETRAVAQPAVR